MTVLQTQTPALAGAFRPEQLPGAGALVPVMPSAVPSTAALTGPQAQAGAVDLLALDIASFRLAIPRSAILEVVAIGAAGDQKLARLGEGLVLRLREQLLPVADGWALIGAGARPEGAAFVLVMATAQGPVGLLIGRIVDAESRTVEPVAPILHAPPIFAGQVVLTDGTPALVLEPAAIARATTGAGIDARAATAAASVETVRHEPTSDFLIVRFGDGALKAVPLQTVVRIERFKSGQIETAGGRLVVQHGEQLMPLAGSVGGTQAKDEQLVLVIAAEPDSVGLMVDEIIDLKAIPTSRFRPVRGASAQRAAIVDGRAVDFLDVWSALGDLIGFGPAATQEVTVQ